MVSGLKTMLQAVIFDMDGLLIDSEPFWRTSHIEALKEYDVVITEDDVRQMAGRRTDEVIRHWREHHGLTQVSTEILEQQVVDKVISYVRLNGTELPGVRQLIALLESRHVPMAVASSSSPEIIKAVLEKLRLVQHMKVTYSAKYEEFGKPHPAVFLTTASKLGVSPGNCLVFEDSLNGVRAAKAAGMLCIAVPEIANRNMQEFFDEADKVVDTLEKVDWVMIQSLFNRQ